MDHRQLASEVLRVAGAVLADSLDDFLRRYERGGYEYAAVFRGKRSASGDPTSFLKGKLKEDSVRRAVVEVLDVQETPNTLTLTFTGTAGRVDTYVFTREPYASLFPLSKPPRKSVLEVADEVKEKLIALGLHSLGSRYGKAGDQFGTASGARRISVGRRDLLLNQLLVSVDNEYAVRRPDTRWNLYRSFLLSRVTDDLLEKAVEWVKAGSTMIEVRDKARDRYLQTGEVAVELG